MAMYSAAELMSSWASISEKGTGPCRAASAGRDQTVKVWDLATSDVFATYTAGGELGSVAFGDGGNIVVAGDRLGQVHQLRLEPDR